MTESHFNNLCSLNELLVIVYHNNVTLKLKDYLKFLQVKLVTL